MTYPKSLPTNLSQGGWTLFHMLALFAIVCILGAVQARMVVTASRLTNQAAWGRSAETLADGALEAALAHLEAGGQAGHLEIPLDTGRAVADISPSEATREYTVAFAGIAASEERIRAERHYKGIATKAGDGGWRIRSVKRISQ